MAELIYSNPINHSENFMGKKWNYAKLSALAKQNGGPEALLDKIIAASKQKGYRVGFVKGMDAGHSKGVSDTLCVVFIIVGASLVAYFSYKLYVRKVIKHLKEMSSDEIEETKKKLVEGIENYDRMHGENQ